MKAVIYCRYSPRPDDLCESLEFQADFVRRYFDYAGVEVGRVIGDAETSARKVPLRKRKGGAELLDLTSGRNPAFQVVGAYRLDRLWRSVVDGNLTLAKWAKCGVACHFAAEGGQSINTATATGRFIVNVLLAKAEYEPDLTAERTQSAMLRKQANGQAMSKRPPYGFRRVGKLLEVDQHERLVAERIISMRSSGLGFREIGRLLASEGIKCRGNGWHHSTIKAIWSRASDPAS